MYSRRSFLQTLGGAGALAAVGEFSFLSALRPVSAQEVHVQPGMVRLRPELEPLVRLLEVTPRNQVLEAVAAELKRGASYQQVLAALMLAGVRNINPHPVGFKFHAVLVVNSAHQASIASPDSDRWLPIFWAIDQFKVSQAQDVGEGDWHLPSVPNSVLPPPHQARERFAAAMDAWDLEASDRAIAQWTRVGSAAEVFETLWRFGARDFRDIGHKAIYVANAWRTLQVIGWEHAEPILRSVSMALNFRSGTRGNPAELDDPADRPWRRNVELVRRVRPDWMGGKPQNAATAELLSVLRQGSPNDACDAVVDALNRGVASQSLWDAVLNASGELLMRRPGILGIHCVTSANALRYAADTAASAETRLLMLLQGAAFMALFRQQMGLDGKSGPLVDQLEAADASATGPEALEAIFSAVGPNRMEAARRTLAYLKHGGSANELLMAARRLIFLKGTNSHDYKFSSAALEDYHALSPAWRDAYLATAMFNLRGAGEKDNPLVARTRSALSG